MITKIEGLEKCTKLTDLSLFKNQIKNLAGLENLKELNVLSLGSNALGNLEESVNYLRKLKNNLEVLRISDNAFQKTRTSEYKKYTIARLKDLKYIDYELIEAKEREQANEEHKDEMGQVEQAEGADRNDDAAGLMDAELADAKIECTNEIFNRVLAASDEEMKKLQMFIKF